MKAGIISFHNANNYGAVLQNYALQRALEDLGQEAITINYCCPAIERKDYRFYSWNTSQSLINNVMHLFFWLLNYVKSTNRAKSFDDFRAKNMKLSNPVDTNTVNLESEKYDVYICGSDQIWNRDIVQEDAYAYSLGFVSKRPKASYAASSGTASLDDAEIISLIRELDYVTVREISLVDDLKKKGICSEVVCDPVFLLSREKWEELICGVSAHTAGGVFSYFVDDGAFDDCARIANSIAAGRDVFIPSPICKKLLKYKNQSILEDGPLQFLADLYAADYIVASSFHAVAFCIIFEKQFIAVPYGQKGQRIIDLLSVLGLESRIVSGYDDFVQKKDVLMKETSVKDEIRLIKYRDDSLALLKKICELGQ